MRLGAALLALLAFAGPALADPLCQFPGVLNPMPNSAVSLTISTTACTLVTCTGGSAIPANAAAAFVSIETNAIRFWDDGTVPTATTGQPVTAASTISLCGSAALKNVQFIRQSADATARVSYYSR